MSGGPFVPISLQLAGGRVKDQRAQRTVTYRCSLYLTHNGSHGLPCRLVRDKTIIAELLTEVKAMAQLSTSGDNSENTYKVRYVFKIY